MSDPRIEVLCFGTELLRDKVNTNIVTVAEKLWAVGLEVALASTVCDDAAEVERALREALERSTVVIASGGLGPTFDDLTRDCAAKVLRRPLRYSSPLMSQIANRFKAAGLPMPKENERQAYLVGTAEPIINRVGTAPGQIIEHGKKMLILLPGPPKELIPMLDGAVVPLLKRRYAKGALRSLVLHHFGYSESSIDELIEPVVRKDWSPGGVQTVFGILAHRSIIDVKVSARGKSAAAVNRVFAQIREELYKRLGERVYGEDDDTLETIVGKLLKKKRQTLSTAESCTGGLLSHRITNAAGSSDYFQWGAITYSNESKQEMLGVRRETLLEHGAVSEPVAREMAQGVMERSGADWGVAVTGIAGPGGGSRAKPVGLVCFAVASKSGSQTWTKNFSGYRVEIKDKSALTALDLLRKKLLNP